MRTPKSVRALEDFTRTRLSKNFFMRDFLYSEIAAIEGFHNLPSDPALAVAAGSALCEQLLEPLQATFGRIAIRSAYRSAQVNEFGNENFQSCARNSYDRARHIWDERDDEGLMGAMTTVIVPWFVDRNLSDGTPWTALAWWIHDNLPYSELQWFPKHMAFNIAWHERPKRRISSFVAPRGLLTKAGMANNGRGHAAEYHGFPALAQA